MHDGVHRTAIRHTVRPQGFDAHRNRGCFHPRIQYPTLLESSPGPCVTMREDTSMNSRSQQQNMMRSKSAECRWNLSWTRPKMPHWTLSRLNRWPKQLLRTRPRQPLILPLRRILLGPNLNQHPLVKYSAHLHRRRTLPRLRQRLRPIPPPRLRHLHQINPPQIPRLHLTIRVHRRQ
jgi:hypothetical protein